jgi:hypothetical protein
MSASRSVSPTRDKKDEKKEIRFLNGWSKEQEQLMADWSDIAMCYRWLHDNAEKIYHGKNLWINLPVIILTTLGGTASFGVQSIFADNSAMKQYASFAIGGVSLFAGILTTIGNYLRYAQLEESNRVASIAWGKFQRLIAVELALNPIERMDSMDFLKICRSDLDRLIEQSPPIPKEAIAIFERKFGEVRHLKKPDICGALEHTTVYDSSETRLKQVAVDAAIMLKQRRQTLNELLMPQVQETIQKKVDKAMKEKEEEMKELKDVRETRKEFTRNRILSRPNIHKIKDYHAITMKPLIGDSGNVEQDVDVIPNPLFNPIPLELKNSIQPEFKNEVILSPRPVEPVEKPQDIEPIQGLTIPRLD